MTTADDMIAATFKAFRLVRLTLEEDQSALESELADVAVGPNAHDVLRAAVALAAQEMSTARGPQAALDFARRAVAAD